MAPEGLHHPLRSEATLYELHRHERVDFGTPEAEALMSAARLVEQMNLVFLDAAVTGWEPFEGSLGLPRRIDEHVLSTTSCAQALEDLSVSVD